MLAIFLFLILFILLFFPLATYALFWYEVGNSGYRLEVQRKSERKMMSWILKGLFSGFWSQILVILFFPFGLFKSFWKSGAEGNFALPPVVLIHGIYHNASAWILFRLRLKNAGYHRIYMISYSSRRHSFQEIEQQLAQRLKEIGTLEKGKPVLLVGHSLGGLFAKAYAGRKDGSPGPAVKGIITLGTPFKGSKMAVFGLGKLAQSLSYGSDLIKELATTKVPSQTPCASLYSPVDNMVLPPESVAAAPENWIKEETAPISHVACLYHKPTFNQVVRLLSQFSDNRLI